MLVYDRLGQRAERLDDTAKGAMRAQGASASQFERVRMPSSYTKLRNAFLAILLLLPLLRRR